jgi:hypothetical protein
MTMVLRIEGLSYERVGAIVEPAKLDLAVTSEHAPADEMGFSRQPMLKLRMPGPGEANV